MNKPCVNEALFKELQDIFRTNQSKSRIYMVIEHIRKTTGIKRTIGWERLLLYGRRNTNDKNEIYEHSVGWLIAIAPGIVILDSDNLDPMLSGLLERSIGQFQLKAFFGIGSNVGIKPPKINSLLQNYPMTINWDLGRDDYDTYGIDPARWGVMKPWLDKWLPE